VRRHRAPPRPLASLGSAERSRPPDLPRGRLAVGASGPTRGWRSRRGPSPARHCDRYPTRRGAKPSSTHLLCSSVLGWGHDVLPVAGHPGSRPSSHVTIAPSSTRSKGGGRRGRIMVQATGTEAHGEGLALLPLLALCPSPALLRPAILLWCAKILSS